MTDIDAALIAAHAAQDSAALVTLYRSAADAAADINTACFFLTHAYVFALDCNHPAQAELYQRLRVHGRV